MEWESVIGLEVHVQLNTKTKLFCNCVTSFGEEANIHTCPVCLGHPGVLPVLNKEAYLKAVTAGLATNCKINKTSKFDRKNYFYPDLPKAYQITQFAMPVCENGYLEITTDDGIKKIGLTRIHIEEDPAKLIHEHGVTYADFNRSGTPLIEIVSEPDIRSPEEAVRYLQKLKAILIYIETSDCNMDQGSLRCDANISIRPKGEKELGNRTEIKNMNTFKGIQVALEYEIKRQIREKEAGKNITVETRLWDTEKKITRVMRSKEEAHDYRYFPEPDILPCVIEDAQVKEISEMMPELPDAKRIRFISEYSLSNYDAEVLVSEKELAEYYEGAVRSFPEAPKKICNWITVEVNAYLNENNMSIKDMPIPPESIGELIKVVTDGTINGKIAKEIFPEMMKNKKTPLQIIEEKGLKQVTDDSLIRKTVQSVVDANPDIVEKYKAGNKKVGGFFVGQVMKETGGKANPQIVNQILNEILG